MAESNWGWATPTSAFYYPPPYPPVYNPYSDLSVSQMGIVERQSVSSPGGMTYGSAGQSNYDPSYRAPEAPERDATGFESFLVPNPWFGILPWGAEGVLIVVVAIIVIAVPIAAIVYLFVKIVKLVIFLSVEYSQKQQRSLISNSEYLRRITFNVLEAIDKYGEISESERE